MEKEVETMIPRERLVVLDDPKAVEAEAFRVLRTNLQFTSPDRELKTLLVTSASPGEGKSIIVSNLALAWAQSGAQVAAVDCDLRRPNLHKMFAVNNTPGLTGHLLGQAALEEALVPSGLAGLDLIPCGPLPPNPAELLQSKVMGQIIFRLRDRYDLVIFDAAPVIAVTDAAVLASQVDGTVLVVKAHHVPKDVVLQAKKLLEQAQARLLGVVLNGVRPQRHKNYHYQYYYGDAGQAP